MRRQEDGRVADSSLGRRGLLLSTTLAAAAAVTAGVTALVLTLDPATGLSEALRTGGLAGASVVALYGLWLNDRRRRTEEARQVVEQERLRLEGARVTDERFARSIELLGHDADQVRLGAMHALAGLARTAPSYAQTAADVFCAYLRRPFFHRAYERAEFDTDRNDYAEPTGGRVSDADAVEDRERQVRLTAQRLLGELLPRAGEPGGAVDLDLTGASLEFLNLSDRAVGELIARRAVWYGITRLSGAVFAGRVLLTGSVFRGRLELDDVRFGRGLSLLEAHLAGPVDLSNARIAEFADLRWNEPAGVDLTGASATAGTDVLVLPGTELSLEF